MIVSYLINYSNTITTCVNQLYNSNTMDNAYPISVYHNDTIMVQCCVHSRNYMYCIMQCQ